MTSRESPSKYLLIDAHIWNLGILKFTWSSEHYSEKQINDEIADIDAEENFNTVKDSVKHLEDDDENLNCIKKWKLSKKVCCCKSFFVQAAADLTKLTPSPATAPLSSHGLRENSNVPSWLGRGRR